MLVLLIMGLLCFATDVNEARPQSASESDDSAVFFAGTSPDVVVRVIFRLVEGQQPYVLSASSTNGPVVFSPNDTYVAFDSIGGMLVSNLSDWRPAIAINYVAQPVNGELVTPPVNVMWTPSSDRIIYTYYSMDRQTLTPASYLVSRIGTEDTFDPDFWPWSQCDQIAREVTTNRLALICEALSPYAEQIVQNNYPPAVAVFYDGTYEEYVPDSYMMLIGQSGMTLPHYEWFYRDGTETFVYFQTIAGQPAGTVNAIQGVQAAQAVLTQPVGQTPAFTTSPDRNFIAFVERIEPDLGSAQTCLRVADFNTGAVIWDDNDQYCMPENSVSSINLIAWYPDSQHLAVSGTDPELDAYIKKIDLISGSETLLLSGFTTIEALAVALPS
jgi:WD40 repeat protein